MTRPATVEQVVSVRRFAAVQAAGTAAGREWLQRVRPVAPELVRLYSGLPRVREHVDVALARAAKLVQSPQASIGADDIRAFESALSAIEAAASPELRAFTGAVVDELPRASGRTLRDAIG